MASAEGDIYLFRVIGGEYNRGQTLGQWLTKEKAYSYSLNPYIAKQWAYYPNRYTNYVIISEQNLYRENLRFPKKGFYNRLLPSTPVREISYYNEVKVPIQDENPVVIMTVRDFQSMKEETGLSARTFTMDNLLDEVWQRQSNAPTALRLP